MDVLDMVYLLSLLALVIFALVKGVKVVGEMPNYKKVPQYIKKWYPYALLASQKTGVTVDLILSVIWTESGGNEFAIGSADEIGLMQLKPIAVRDVEQNFAIDTRGWDIEPEKNILVGAYYLKLQKKRVGTWNGALGAYNQGETGAKNKPALAQIYIDRVNNKLEYFV